MKKRTRKHNNKHSKQTKNMKRHLRKKRRVIDLDARYVAQRAASQDTACPQNDIDKTTLTARQTDELFRDASQHFASMTWALHPKGLSLSQSEYLVFAIIFHATFQSTQACFDKSTQELADWCGGSLKNTEKIVGTLIERKIILRLADPKDKRRRVLIAVKQTCAQAIKSYTAALFNTHVEKSGHTPKHGEVSPFGALDAPNRMELEKNPETDVCRALTKAESAVLMQALKSYPRKTSAQRMGALKRAFAHAIDAGLSCDCILAAVAEYRRWIYARKDKLHAISFEHFLAPIKGKWHYAIQKCLNISAKPTHRTAFTHEHMVEHLSKLLKSAHDGVEKLWLLIDGKITWECKKNCTAQEAIERFIKSHHKYLADTYAFQEGGLLVA